MTNLSARDNGLIWHPFTQHQTERAPVGISHANGAVLYNEQGEEILDLISSWWTITHGHAHPKITEALYAQAKNMSHVMFSGFTHEPAVTIAESITSRLGGDLAHVFFSDNGSTSIEVALKMAFHYWRNCGNLTRTNFIAFDGGYHGDTFGAMSVGKGSGFFNLYEDLLCDVDVLPFAATHIGDEQVEEREAQALETLKVALEKNGDTYAAMIIEPMVQGAGGMKMCRPHFIQAIVELARSHGILVIFDEVMVGFGRTGTLFAHEQTDVIPDIICLSKGLTAGTLPLSLTVATSQIYDAFLGADFNRALAHGHSFTGNPLACAVANQSLQIFEEERTLERIGEIKGKHLDFTEKLAGMESIVNGRVCGSILAFDLLSSDGGYKSELSLKLRDYFLDHGLNIRPLGNTIYLMPPYCISDEQLNIAYDGLLQGLNAV